MLSRVGNAPLKLASKLTVLALLGLLAGCAGKKTKFGPTFFPPPPDEPRVQYLTGLSSSADFKAEKGNLLSLVVGGSETITKLAKPYGMALHKGKFYISDVNANQIVVVDFANKTVKNFVDEPGSGRLNKPISVAVDEDGYVYVADTARKDIAVYTPQGKFLKSLGKDLDKTNLMGVALYKDQLFALDNRKGLIFILDKKTGELLNTIGNNSDRSKNLSLPNGMTVDSKGNIHVVNVGNGTVKEYDRDGNMLSVFGKIGDLPGEFTRPRGITVDEDGFIYVVDAGHQVVQIFNAQHRILGFIGGVGLPEGSLNLPAGIVVTKELLDVFQPYAAPGFKLQKLIFVTNQYTSLINQSLSIYGMGEMEGAKERDAERARKDAEKKQKGPGKK